MRLQIVLLVSSSGTHVPQNIQLSTVLQTQCFKHAFSNMLTVDVNAINLSVLKQCQKMKSYYNWLMKVFLQCYFMQTAKVDAME